ncbi:MAG: hypothetical protein ACYDDS_17350 [Candidatus Sulfotelmatobacter sp.]|jgi:hypothetical protein
MKVSIRISIVLLVSALMIAGIPAANAACSNASVNGVYGITSTGLNGSLQPAASVDQITADGAGNITGSSTKSIDGSIVTFTFTGTYSIAANCTGKATFKNQDGTTEHDNIFLNNNNTGAFLIQTDSNHVQSSVAVAQGLATCTNLAVKRSYSFEGTGIVIGTGQVALAGRLSLNGTGSITGTETLSLNGVISSSLPVTGTYQINADCTGTATITPSGFSPTHLSLVVVNADKEIMAIETDSNTIVTGTFQQ